MTNHTTRQNRPCVARAAVMASVLLITMSCGSSKGSSTSRTTAAQAPTTAAPPPPGAVVSASKPSKLDPQKCVLTTREFNDYCTFEDPDASKPGSAASEDATVNALTIAGATVDNCGTEHKNGYVAYLANSLVIYPNTKDNQAAVAAQLKAVFPGSDIDWVKLEGAPASNLGNGFVRLLNNAHLTRAAMKYMQLPGVAVDLNYLATSAPNWTFKPVDAPTLPGASGPAVQPDDPKGLGKSVLVIDSPPPADNDKTGLLDAAYGHNEFVQDLIRRHVTSGAITKIIPISVGHKNIQSKDPNAADYFVFAEPRWSPMVFTEQDLLDALTEAVSKSADVWNVSLGAYGCPGDVTYLPIAKFLADNATGVPIFAAAGNSGVLQPHYPSALRDSSIITAMKSAVEAAATELKDNHADAAKKLTDAAVGISTVSGRLGSLHAVGSIEKDGKKSDFSTCGAFIDVQAPGRQQIATYPAINRPSGTDGVEAMWSGTSFATARATAAFLSGNDPSKTVTGDVGPASTALFATCPP